MAIKVVLRKRKNADSTHPLILQVWKNGKAATVTLEYSIEAKYWDKKTRTVKSSHPNSVRLNNYLRKKLTETTEGSLELEGEKKHFSSKATTIGYQANFINQDADDALDAVINKTTFAKFKVEPSL